MNIQLIFGIYFLAVNLAAFAAMGIDKHKARKHEWRISERMLFLFPLLGGAFGGFVGMRFFRHKTKHWYFRFGIPAILIIQIIAMAFVGYVGDYYHADKRAQESLVSSDNVRVIKEDNDYFFDGPGETDTALIFYPGGKVEYTAYAPLLNRMAEAGIDCFLVRMPFNLAVFGSNRAERIISEHSYGRWFISGHSLGGAMAASYASEHLSELEGLVLMGAYPTRSLQEDGFSVLSIYGSEDHVLNRDKVESGMEYMPEDYAELCIDGGNHAWFGSYGEQSGDGKAKIDHEKQWEQTVDAVLLYTRNRKIPVMGDRRKGETDNEVNDSQRHTWVGVLL